MTITYSLFAFLCSMWNDDWSFEVCRQHAASIAQCEYCWTILQCSLCREEALISQSRTLLAQQCNRFMALFLGPPRWAGARRELLDFMVQGKINRGKHIDHPAGRHSIQTNQWPPPPSPIFLQAGCPSCRPTNSVKALKATSAFVLGRRR